MKYALLALVVLSSLATAHSGQGGQQLHHHLQAGF
jgi:hypothetical protein